MVGELQVKRVVRALGLLFVVACYIPFSFQNAYAASGITYTGRIFKGDQPLDSGIVRFDVWVKTKDNCVLYYERRNIDMTGSSGTYSFEIGDANIVPGSQSFPQTGIQTIGDLFNNAKSRANGDVDTSLPCSTFNPASDEGRLMTVSFTPQGETAQALPDLAITAVPTAFQAFNANKVNGYGTGDLLKVDSSVNKTTYANNALSQAQYDEFWKLILGTSTTYLKSIPTLGGDVTGTLPAVTVTKIQNVAVTAPTTGDTGKVLTYNGTGMVWSAAAAGGITTLNGETGATQSFAVGSGGTDFNISSSSGTHTFNIPSASSSNRGLLTSADWNTFNSKQSSSLGSGQVWIGNASNGAQAQTLSGDATVSASGNVTVDKTQNATGSKILQLDSSGNAYVAGVDIKGTGASAKLRFTGSTDMVMNLPTTSGTANQFLQTDGAGNLSWGSQSAMLPTISAGQVWVGNASNGAQAFSLTGDIASVSSTGVVTLSSSATGSNKLPLAGGTMSGAINMGGQNISNAGDVSLAAGKFLGLGVGSTAGTVTGQMWYDSGIIKYFDGTSVQSLGVAGAGITSLNGLTSGTQSFVVGSAGNAPAITSASSAHTLDIPMASASGSVTAGLISNADYASMMAKQSGSLVAGQVWVGNASGAAQAFALSGDISSVSNTGSVTVNKTTTGQANYILALDGSGVANVKGLDVQTGTGKVTLQTAGAFTNYTLTLPNASPSANQIMKSDASGNLSWVTYLANVSDSAPLTNGKMWIGNASGIASEVTMSGDATITNAGLLTLKSIGTSGTYTKVVTDAQGRVTSGSALASSDITTALGYTPVNKAGDTMSGDLTTQNLNVAAGKFLGLGAGSTAGTVAGQIWYDSGVIKYFDGTSAQSLGVAGAGITSLNGLTSNTQSFVNGTSGTAPAFSSAGSAHTLNIPMASASGSVTAGLISNADYASMMAKQSNTLAAGQVWVGNASGAAEAFALSGDISSVSNTGSVTVNKTTTGQANYILALDGTGVANVKGLDVQSGTGKVTFLTNGAFTNYTLTLPNASPSANQIMKSDASGNLSWVTYLANVSDSAPLTNGKMWIGNASGIASEVTMSGDATITNAGLLSLKNTGTAGTYTKVVTDAQGRVTSGSALVASDVTTALGYTPVNKAGDTMSGDLNTQDINIAAGKFLGLGVGSTAGTVAGQIWYDSGVIKYFDGTTAKSLGVAGSGITSLNGLTSNTQSFVVGSAGNAPAITSASSAHTLDIPMASASGSVTAGLISNADYASMMAKQSNALADSFVWIGNASGAAQARTLSGDVTISNVGLVTLKNTGTSGTYFKIVTDAQGRVTSGSALASGDVTAALGYTPASSATGYVNGGNTFGANATLGLNDAFKLGFKTNNATQMTLDSNGNLGIGTASPGRKLHVQYTASASDDGIIIDNLGNAGANLSLKSSGAGGHEYMMISTGSANSTGAGYFGIYDQNAVTYRMVIGPTGNVGFGTAAPGYTLDLGSRTDALRLPSGLDATRPANAAGLIRYNTTSNVVEYNNGSGWVSIGSSVGNTLAAGQMWVGNASGVAQAFSLTGDVSSVSSSGSVVVNKTMTGQSNTILSLDGTGVANAYGVGVKGATSGTVTLQAAATTANYSLKLPATTPVANQVMQSDASGNLSWTTPLTSGTAYVNGGNTFAGNATIGLNDAYNLGFKTNNTTKMTLTSDGKLGIGTTTPNTALAIASGDITLDAGYSMMWGQSAYSFINGDSGPSSHLILGTSGAIVMTLDVNGNVGIGTNPAFTLDMGSRTDAVRLPQGTTGEQPANTKGLIRFNTTSNTVEYNNGSAWVTVGSALGYTPVNKAGDTMSGDLTTQNLNIAAGKYLGLGAGSTAGTVAGQMWYDSGVIKYFDGTSAKSLGVAGSGITSLNGLTSGVQSFVIGTSGTAPAFSSAGSAHTLNIPMASASSVTAGLLSNADYAAFSSKMSSALPSTQVWVGNASGAAVAVGLSGDVSSISNTGVVTVNKTTTGANNTILSIDGSGVANAYGFGVKGATSGTVTLQAATTTANYSLKLPATTPAANQVMQSDASGNLSWVNGVTTSTGYINGGNTFAGNATIGLNDAYTLGLKTNNATRMTIDSSGNVGVGTSTPQLKLDISGNAVVRGAATSNCNEGMNITRAATSDYTWTTWHTGTSASSAPSCGDMDWMLGMTSSQSDFYLVSTSMSGGPLGRADAPFQVSKATGNMYFGAKVGVGTTSPSVSLDVGSKTDAVRLPAGNSSQRPANATGLIRYNTSNSTLEYNDGSAWATLVSSSSGYANGGNTFAGNATIGLNDAYTLGFKTNNATQMTLTAAGRLGIGTATPSGTLEVQGGTAAAGVTGVPITLKAQNGGSGGAVGGSIVLTPGDGTSGWPGGTVVIATTGGQNGALSVTNDKTNSYASTAASTSPSYAFRMTNSYNQNGNTALVNGNVKNSSGLYQEGYMGFVSVTGASNYSPDYVVGLQNGSNSYQERLRINGSTGNVGIGTSSPAATLDVVGSAAFENNAVSTAAANFSFWKSRNYAAVQLNDNLGFFSYYGSDGVGQQRSAYISSTVDDTVATNSVPANLVFATTQAGGTDSTERMRITSGGNVGINTTPTGNAKLEVSGAIVSVGRSVASGATVNLAQGNTTVLASVGGSAITLQNMVNGGNYTLVITDTTSRTYTFTGCNSSKYSPANQATINGTPSVYNILTIYNGASYDCYITWSTGFQ